MLTPGVPTVYDASPRRPSHPAAEVSISPNAGGNWDGGLALRGGVSAVRRGVDGGVGGASAPPPRAPGIELAAVRFSRQRVCLSSLRVVQAATSIS